MSTISRTPLAKLLTITLAESVLGLVSPSTHTYSKYLKPSELEHFLTREKGWGKMEKRGCVYDPVASRWRLLDDWTWRRSKRRRYWLRSAGASTLSSRGTNIRSRFVVEQVYDLLRLSSRGRRGAIVLSSVG